MLEGTTGIDTYDYEPSPLWEVVGSNAYVEQEKYEASVVFTLSLKRKPRYTVLNIILPLIMLTILNVLVFALPCDSGEKASYAVTVFLSFAVFLTIISSQLPENSNIVSLFSVYLIFQTVQSTAITVIALILIRISSFDSDTPIPKVLAYMVACFNCKICSNQATKVGPSDRKKSVQVTNMDEGFENRQAYIDDAAVPLEETYTWKQVVNTLDMVLIIFFSLTAFLSTVIPLVVAQNA